MVVTFILDLLARFLRAILALPFLLAEKVSELRLALAALMCRIQVQRCVMGPYVLIYQNVVGGYHPNQDIEDAWRDLHSILTSTAPHLQWSSTPSFRICYDDQFSKPFGETCRSSLGYVVSKNCGDPHAVTAAWKSLFEVSEISGSRSHLPRVKVDYLPRGECLAAFFPHQGRLSHSIAVGRLILWSWIRQNTSFIVPISSSSSSSLSSSFEKSNSEEVEDAVCFNACGSIGTQKVPGIMQICDPTSQTLSFLLPLEERETMLPFDLKQACRPWRIYEES